MNKKRNPNEIGAAIGYISNFFGPLVEALMRVGGRPEMLYFARAEHARPMMELLAKTIVESSLWKVPKSLIIQEIHKFCSEDLDEMEYWEENSAYLWARCSPTALWLSTLRFCDELEQANDGKVPKALHIVFDGDRAKCGHTIYWSNQWWVITFIDYSCSTSTRWLYLAPAEWIDLEN